MLKVTLGTGEVLEIPFNRDSSLTVTSIKTVDGLQVETAEAHADVVGIEIVDDPIVETPTPVTMTGAEAAASTSGDPGDEQPATNPDSGVEPGTEPPVAEPDPTTDGSTTSGGGGDASGSATTTSSDASSASSQTPPAGDESLLQKVEDHLGIGSHDDAVAAAQSAVTAATAGNATIDHVTAAIADVNAALAAYPDSAELADAKFQLESLAGTQSAPGA